MLILRSGYRRRLKRGVRWPARRVVGGALYPRARGERVASAARRSCRSSEVGGMPPGALGAGLGPQPLGVYPHRTTHWSGRATMGIMWPTWAGLVWPAAHRERSVALWRHSGAEDKGRLGAKT